MQPNYRQKFIPVRYRRTVTELSAVILRLWEDQPEAWLIHREIVSRLASQGVAKHKAVRGIERLILEGKLEKYQQARSSGYRPIYKLKEHSTLEYLSDLHSAVSKRGMVHDWGVGGWFSYAAAGTIVGFPPVEREALRQDERLALDTILVRISEMYSALMDLRDVLLIRSAGGDAKFGDDLTRQVLLECYIRRLDKTMGRTDSVFNELGSSLGEWAEPAKYMCKRNAVGREDPTRLDAIPLSLTLVHPFPRLLQVKKHLREEGIDIDRHSLRELASRLRKAQVKMDRQADKVLRSVRPEDRKGLIEIPIPERTRDDLSLLGRAYAVKLAEVFSLRGLRELQDMALVVTRHPNTMETQMTTERMLSEFIEVMKEAKGKEIAGLSEEKLARFLGKGFGESHYRSPPEEVEALGDKPWLKRELGDHFDTFLDEYRTARIQRIEFERKEHRAFEEALRNLNGPQTSGREQVGSGS